MAATGTTGGDAHLVPAPPVTGHQAPPVIAAYRAGRNVRVA